MAFQERFGEGGNRPYFRETTKGNGFSVSNAAFNKATVLTNIAVPSFLFIVWVFKKEFVIEHSDLQTLCQITAQVAGLALAIPLFLKDFSIDSNFWKHFFLIATTFLISTFIGVYLFMEFQETFKGDIVLSIFVILIFVLTVNITTVRILWKGARKTEKKYDFKLEGTYSFPIVFVLIIDTILISKGNSILAAFLATAIYGFILIFVLILSILIEIFVSNGQLSFEEEVKKAIEEELNSNPSLVYSEDFLVDRLRKAHFINDQGQIGRAKVRELVLEMNLEDERDKPKLTLIGEDSAIPRWNNEFQKELMDAKPKILLKKDSTENFTSVSEFGDEYFEKLKKVLAENTGMSLELLEDGNSIETKYQGDFVSEGKFFFGFQKDEYHRIENAKLSGIEDLRALVNSIQVNMYWGNIENKDRDEERKQKFILNFLFSTLKKDMFFGQTIDWESRIYDLIVSFPDQPISFHTEKIFTELTGQMFFVKGDHIQEYLVNMYGNSIEETVHTLESKNKIERVKRTTQGKLKRNLEDGWKISE